MLSSRSFFLFCVSKRYNDSGNCIATNLFMVGNNWTKWKKSWPGEQTNLKPSFAQWFDYDFRTFRKIDCAIVSVHFFCFCLLCNQTIWMMRTELTSAPNAVAFQLQHFSTEFRFVIIFYDLTRREVSLDAPVAISFFSAFGFVVMHWRQWPMKIACQTKNNKQKSRERKMRKDLLS